MTYVNRETVCVQVRSIDCCATHILRIVFDRSNDISSDMNINATWLYSKLKSVNIDSVHIIHKRTLFLFFIGRRNRSNSCRRERGRERYKNSLHCRANLSKLSIGSSDEVPFKLKFQLKCASAIMNFGFIFGLIDEHSVRQYWYWRCIVRLFARWMAEEQAQHSFSIASNEACACVTVWTSDISSEDLLLRIFASNFMIRYLSWPGFGSNWNSSQRRGAPLVQRAHYITPSINVLESSVDFYPSSIGM